MLRITLEEHPSGPTIKLEGRLVGPWVCEFHNYWNAYQDDSAVQHLRVDLKAVTAIDENGKALLQQIHQRGGTFVASGCLTKAIVEEVTSEGS